MIHSTFIINDSAVSYTILVIITVICNTVSITGSSLIHRVLLHFSINASIHTNPRTNNSCMSRYAYKQVIDRCKNKLFNWLVGIFYRISDRKKKCVAISDISSTYTVELLKLSGANFNGLRKFYRFVGSHLVYSFIILFPKGNTV